MLVLPENMREEIRKPFGRVLRGKEFLQESKKAIKPLIAVGDQCAHDLITAGIAPDIIVFDFKVKRVEIPKEMKKTFVPHAKEAYAVLSGAGHISDELLIAIEKVLEKEKGAIFVVGEDDLSSLAIMARAKKGTLVYGQPDQGAVIVELGSKSITEKAKGFLNRMQKVQ